MNILLDGKYATRVFISTQLLRLLKSCVLFQFSSIVYPGFTVTAGGKNVVLTAGLGFEISEQCCFKTTYFVAGVGGGGVGVEGSQIPERGTN